MPLPETYLCPICDDNVPVGKNCPCLRPKQQKKNKVPPRKSWEQDDTYDGLDLPDDDFDYDDFIAKEFGQNKPHRQIGIPFYWWFTALILALIWFFVLF